MMDILFGTIRPSLCCKPISFEMNSFTTSVSPRTLLPSSVIFSEATESWVATVNTSQKILDSKNEKKAQRLLEPFQCQPRNTQCALQSLGLHQECTLFHPVQNALFVRRNLPCFEGHVIAETVVYAYVARALYSGHQRCFQRLIILRASA